MFFNYSSNLKLPKSTYLALQQPKLRHIENVVLYCKIFSVCDARTISQTKHAFTKVFSCQNIPLYDIVS